MPNSNLSSPAVGMSLEELNNLMFQYYRELQYLLNGNLDEQNVIRAQSVIADWVYAGGITTDQITAGTAKITTAMIETLTVGDNVIMGEDAAISWSKVTDKPTIITTDDALTAWANSNYATYIDANGVYSGSFNGGMFNVNPTGSQTLVSGLTIGGWWNTSWTGEVFRLQFDDDYFGSGFPATVFSSASGMPLAFTANVVFVGTAGFNGNVGFDAFQRVDFDGEVNFKSDVDFDGATLFNFPGYTHAHDDRYYTQTESDSRYATANHDHGNTYVKTSQNIKIQYFSDHMEISNDGGATWKVINYDA